jgi:hypothetical protein
MNQFNSVAGYKINIKNLTFLYANELAEKEIMKAILFTIDTKKISGINLTKEMKDPYNENKKTLL